MKIKKDCICGINRLNAHWCFSNDYTYYDLCGTIE